MTSWIGRVVATSARHPFIVLLLSLALTAVALVYSAGHFAMTTDTAQLISTKNKWRQHELAYERAFPSLQWLTIVVIDGATPELSEHAASRLSAALAQKPALFHSVRRPDGGPFFDCNGLLFLPLPEVQAATEGLLRSQFLLASLAADPSLRGVLVTLSQALQGVQHGQAKLADFQPLMAALADTFEKAAAGQPAWFSWQDVMADPSNGTSGNGTSGGKRQTRRILIVQPVLDYSALQPGQAASDAIRTTARSLDLDPAHGVTVRLTGPVPLSDEEFASLAEGSDLVAVAMVIALLGILWGAVHSGRVVVAMLLATFMGLVMTTGLGLLETGRFNLISVAFIPLFVGLGIDFSIQFSVRFLAERHFHPGDREALAAAGRGVGLPLALAAAAIGAGFFAFLPTDYIGVAELGLIAGLGMVIAFALTVTLLPALLALLRPAVGALEEVGFAGLAPIEAYLSRNRRAVLAVSLVVALASAAALPFVRFDFNPLHLKSAKVESMATLADLATDPDWTPDTINVLAPSLAAAEPVERRLAALPEVSRTITLRSFVPEGQPEKLALIRAANQRLGPALDVPAAPQPTDEEVRQALVATTPALRQAATDGGPASQTALRLAGALDRLQQATPDVRAAAATAIVLPLRVMLERVRASLQAGPVTIDSLPADLVSDWIGKEGRARIQLFPRPEVRTDDGLWRFAQAVQAIAPDATGVPISIRAAGDTIVVSFLEAGAWSFIAITAILAAALRRVRDVVLTMLPVLLSGLLTFATSAVLDLPLNFANIIALPLLFGVGVAFNIYFVMAWRSGETAPLQSSLMRAVVFSALTTATAFGALWLSSHPGTASMGRLLMISLAWELLVTLLFRPALLAVPPANCQAGR